MTMNTETIHILRDTWGVPHIYAQSELGTIYGQGYAMAHNRLPTMMKAYRKAVGQMAKAWDGCCSRSASSRTPGSSGNAWKDTSSRPRHSQ